MKQLYITLAFLFLAATSFAQFDATIIVTDLGTGLPLQGADVLLDGNFQSTDASGEALFTGLADNTYDFTVMKACYAEGSGTISISGAENSTSIALEARTTNTVFFFIGSPLAISGATVELTDGMNYFDSFVTSTEFNGDNIEGVPYGEISYTITLPCYETITGSVTVDCNNGDGVAVFAEPVEATTNNLFFFVGSPFIITGATVEITDGADYFASVVTSDPFGDMIEGVPYGEISYTITTPCYETITGTVTVDCNNGDGVAVFAEPVEAATNNLFFFVGSPFIITGATVEITDGADYFASVVTSDPFGDMIEGVPYGEISYTITTPCYETITGSVTVDCNNGDGVAVFAEPVEATTNTVFLFIGSPLVITGATVTLTDGADYNVSLVTSDPFGDMVEGVPYGEISYTISLPCYEPISGTVTVDCNNGDGIALFAEPVAIDIDLTVTVSGATLSAAASGVEYQWIDCSNNEPIDGADGQSFEAMVSGNYAVIVTDGDCSQTSDCTAVIVTGVKGNGSLDAFTVYPNPFNDKLTVRVNAQAGIVRLELISMSGQVCLNETRSGMELITLQTAQLPVGSYVLRVTTDNARTMTSLVK